MKAWKYVLKYNRTEIFGIALILKTNTRNVFNIVLIPLG